MRIVQTLQLVDDPGLIEAYKEVHRNVWKEVVEGIRRVGVERMDIYLHGTVLVMIVETAPGVDFDDAMATLAALPRQAEWEEFVGRYQKCAPGSSSGEKWQRMTQIFQLPE